jgi:hypothetical protein
MGQRLLRTACAVLGAVALLTFGAGCSVSVRASKGTTTSGPEASSSRPGAPQTGSNLRSRLLQRADLPAGWSIIRKPSAPASQGFCGRPGTDTIVAPADRAEFEAAGPDPESGPFVNETLSTYDSDGASRAFEIATAAARSCSNYASVLPDGSSEAVEIAPVALPGLRDRSAAFRLQITAGGNRAQGDLLVILVGRTIVRVERLGAWSDPQQLLDFARRSVGRIEVTEAS